MGAARLAVWLLSLALAVLVLHVPPLPAGDGIQVTGRVLNAEGSPIPDVVIEVLRGDVFLLEARTRENGMFSFYVEKSVLRLRFKAPGYEMYELVIDLETRKGPIYSVGTVVLDYAVDVAPEVRVLEVAQGDVVDVLLKISNGGYFREHCNVSIKAPEGWEVEFLTQSGLSVKSFSLDPGAEVLYTVRLHVPRTAKGRYTIAVVVAGVFERRAKLEVLVEEREWMLVEAERVDAVTTSDSRVEFDLRIANNIGERAVFEAGLRYPEGLKARLVDSEGREFARAMLEPGTYIEARLVVKVLPEVPPGEYEVEVKVCALGVCSALNFTVRVVHGYDDLIVVVEDASVDAYPGTVAAFKLAVKNEGLTGTAVTFDIEGLPEGFTYALEDEEGSLVSELYLEGEGGEEVLYLKVYVPEEFGPGFVQLSFKALGRTSEALARLGVNVLGRREVKIVTQNFYVEGEAGSKVRFEVEVENRGHVALSNLELVVVDSPEGISVSVEPPEIPALPPGSRDKFVVHLSIGPGVEPGYYYVELELRADALKISRSLKVSVERRGGSAYLGLLAMILAMIGLALVYSRYRKRAAKA